MAPPALRPGGAPDRKSTRLNSSHADIYALSLHDALPISAGVRSDGHAPVTTDDATTPAGAGLVPTGAAPAEGQHEPAPAPPLPLGHVDPYAPVKHWPAALFGQGGL